MNIPGMESSFSGVGHLRDELTSKNGRIRDE